MARGFPNMTPSFSTPVDENGFRCCPTCSLKYKGLAYGVVKNDGFDQRWQCKECHEKQNNRIREEGFAIDFFTKITKEEYLQIRGYHYQ